MKPKLFSINKDKIVFSKISEFSEDEVYLL